MPSSPDNLDSQLDELVAQAAAQTAAIDSPPPPPPPEGEQDDAAATRNEPLPGAGAEAESIDQLDDLLSERADDALQGAFETVDEVLRESEPAPQVDAATPPRDDDDADADADADPGASFQTLDEALDEMTGVDGAPGTQDPDASEAPPAAPPAEDTAASASAADVAAALDEEESAEPAPAPQPAVAATESTPAAQSEVKPTPARRRQLPGAGPLSHALAMTWAPRWMRDLAGFLGIQTLLLAACLFTYATAGRTIALVTLAAALPLLTILFYLTFIRRRPAA